MRLKSLLSSDGEIHLWQDCLLLEMVSTGQLHLALNLHGMHCVKAASGSYFEVSVWYSARRMGNLPLAASIVQEGDTGRLASTARTWFCINCEKKLQVFDAELVEDVLPDSRSTANPPQ